MMVFAALRYRRPGRPRLAWPQTGSILLLAAGRRLLCAVALVAVLSLTAAALVGPGGELPRRGLSLAGQAASAAAALLAGQAEEDCPSESWLLPLPDARDESFGLAELRSPSWSCGGR